MLIFIIGYMGSGKTMLGARLAEKLEYRFLDMDEMIEVSTGYPIMDYFEKFGENSFRKKEREILISHLDDRRTVIATGGGTPCFEDNMELMNQNGTTVFIDASIETVISRLSGKLMHRPLLSKIQPGHLAGFIKEHMHARMEFYDRAKLKISGEEMELEGLVRELREMMGY